MHSWMIAVDIHVMVGESFGLSWIDESVLECSLRLWMLAWWMRA